MSSKCELDQDIDPFDGAAYPAAHSMDTTWFAVDQDGFIAVMESNEEGAVPIELVERQEIDGDETMKSLAAELGREPEFGDHRMMRPESIGLFSYWGILASPNSEADPEEDDSGESPAIGPYERQTIPEKPLHISALSATKIKELQLYKFENHKFSQDKFIQPALETKCELWTSKNEVLAFDQNGEKVPVPSKFMPRHKSGSNADFKSNSQSTATKEGGSDNLSRLFGSGAANNLRKAMDNFFGTDKNRKD